MSLIYFRTQWGNEFGFWIASLYNAKWLPRPISHQKLFLIELSRGKGRNLEDMWPLWFRLQFPEKTGLYGLTCTPITFPKRQWHTDQSELQRLALLNRREHRCHGGREVPSTPLCAAWGEVDGEATAKQLCDMRSGKEGRRIPEQAAFFFQLDDHRWSGSGLLQRWRHRCISKWQWQCRVDPFCLGP